jgi:hypothetical protein
MRKADSIANISGKLPFDNPPIARPINKGLKRKIQAPCSEGMATCLACNTLLNDIGCIFCKIFIMVTDQKLGVLPVYFSILNEYH